ncbi:unnamed protein product [Bemisia tabaci]|uniref:Uncharacterized protein n=1 Tax=Bemisia tabaci TaxID=7038 RepID=A0A9P0G0I0_BEMTA|nr:unnamed protein product [Bemisia tabaci]
MQIIDVDEEILKKSSKYPKETLSFRNKKNEEAIERLDLKTIDLQKKLDLVRHHAKKRQQYMQKLADDYQEQLSAKINNTASKRMVPNAKLMSSLENSIHQTEMSRMEAEHLRKKYRNIKSNLINDSVTFESILLKLEESILKQEMEISHLQSINQDAIELRNSTKGGLARQEMNAIQAGKLRERQMKDLRFRVEERKLELEKLERRIFPTGRPTLQDVSEQGQDKDKDQIQNQTSEWLETAFDKLKEATGARECEEVLQRFLTQRETKTQLMYLKDQTEREKSDLEHRRDMMDAELEAYKFAEVKDKQQNEEEMENLKIKTENQVQRRIKLEEELKSKTEQIVEIMKRLFGFCIKLAEFGQKIMLPKECPPSEDSEWLLNTLLEKAEAAIFRSKREPIVIEEQDSEDRAVEYTVMTPEDTMWTLGRPKQAEPQSTQAVKKPGEGEEDQEVPTRAFLKRQAQVIIEAKNRRKGYRINVPKFFTEKF